MLEIYENLWKSGSINQADLGDYIWLLYDNDKKEEAFRKAKELVRKQGTPKARILLSQLYILDKQEDKGLEIMRKLHEDSPFNQEILFSFLTNSLYFV